MPEGDGGNTNTGDQGGASPAGGGERTFTQADLDRVVEERLKRERAKYSDYDQLKQKAAEADQSKSDVQKLTDAVGQLKNDLGEERKNNKRSEVARRTGLSMARVERLQGDSIDDMLSDAEKVFDVKADQQNGGSGSGGQTNGGTGSNTAGQQQQTGGGGGGNGQPAGDGGDAGDGSARNALRDKSPSELREGTVPNASGEKTGEQLAEEVWKRTHGGV